MHGRTIPEFAMLSRRLIRLPEIRDGPFKAVCLAAGLAALATPAGEESLLEYDRTFRKPDAGWGPALGTTERTAGRWLQDLLEREIIAPGLASGDYEPDGWTICFETAPGEPWAGEKTKLPLAYVATLPPGQFRLWAVLWSYRDKRGLAWAGQERLADDCGLATRQTRTRLATLAGAGVIRMKRRRRTSSLFWIPEPDDQKLPVKNAKNCRSSDQKLPVKVPKTAYEIETVDRELGDRDSGDRARRGFARDAPAVAFAQSDISHEREIERLKGIEREAERDGDEARWVEARRKRRALERGRA